MALEKADSELVDMVLPIYSHYNSCSSRDITNVTIHITGNDSTLEGLQGTWGGKEASSTYAIDSSGNIAQYVAEKDIPWTNGGETVSVSNPNNNSVTIEVANLTSNGSYEYPVTNEAVDSIIRLCADICQRNGITEFVYTGIEGDLSATCTTHSATFGANKACPGDYITELLESGYITDSVNQILKEGDYDVREDLIYEGYVPRATLYNIDASNYTDELNATDFSVVESGVSGIVSSLKSESSIMSTSVNTGSTTNSFLKDGISSGLNNIKSMCDALGEKIQYELGTLSSNICSVESKMDSVLSTIAGGVSDVKSYLGSLATSFKNTITGLSGNGIISIDESSTSFGSVSSGDISSIVSSVSENVENIISNLSNTKSAISSAVDGFTESMKNCQIWQIFSRKADIYENLLQMGTEALNKYENAVKEAGELITNYLSSCGYDKLDSDRKPILENIIAENEAKIEDRKAKINLKKRVDVYDANGNWLRTDLVNVYTDTEILYFEREILRCEEIIKESQKEIDAIDGFPAILNEATQMVNDALSEIYSSFGTEVSDLDVGVETEYVAPENTTFGTANLESSSDNGQLENNDDTNTAPVSTPTGGSNGGNAGGNYGGSSGSNSGGSSDTTDDKSSDSSKDTKKTSDDEDTTKKDKTSKEETKTDTDTTEETKTDTDTKEETNTKTDTTEETKTTTDNKKEDSSKTDTSSNEEETTKTTILGTNTGGITSSLSSSVSRNIPSRVNYNSNNTSKNSNVTSNTTTNDEITAEIVPEDDTVIIEPVIEPPVVEEDTITPIDPVIEGNTTSTTSQTTSSNKTLKTLGTLAAAGAAVGAAAFGAHTYMKTRENKEEDENYD